MQLIYRKTIGPIEINQQLFSGALHSNSTLPNENDMCHVYLLVYRPPFGQLFFLCTTIHLTSIFMSFTPLGSIFCPLSTYETHMSFSPYDFVINISELPRFAFHQENQNLVCIGMFMIHILRTYYKLSLILLPFIIP